MNIIELIKYWESFRIGSINFNEIELNILVKFQIPNAKMQLEIQKKS